MVLFSCIVNFKMEVFILSDQFNLNLGTKTETNRSSELDGMVVSGTTNYGVSVVEEVDVEVIRNETVERLKNSPEVFKLTQELDLSKSDSILNYGQKSALEISQFADRILATTTKSTVDDSGRMMKDLANIMKSFNPDDFKDDAKRGLISKLFKRGSDVIEKLLAKYKTMDGDIQKIFVQIKEYEGEIKKTNVMLEEMFEKNIRYYEELEKYVIAGTLVRDKLDQDVLPQLTHAVQVSGDMSKQHQLTHLVEMRDLIDQRIMDLELAKMVSLQTAPQIKMIQKGNNTLLRKINSALVVTLPTFKNGLIQAITIKRQKIQAEAMGALDDTTNEMLKRNATNLAQNSVQIAQMGGSSSIKIETIEETFNTIMKGIEDTLAIEEANRQSRGESRRRLEDLQKQLENKRF